MKKRYFILGVVSEAPNSALTATTIDYVCNKFPTHKTILSVLKKDSRFAGHSRLVLLGISELSKKDFEQFVKEQDNG